jgi:hypothetical protein
LAPFLCFVATSWSWIDTDICGVFVTAVCARFCLRWWNKFSGEIEIVLRKYLTKHIFFYYISFFLFSSCCSLLFSLFSAFLSFFYFSLSLLISHTAVHFSFTMCLAPQLRVTSNSHWQSPSPPAKGPQCPPPTSYASARNAPCLYRGATSSSFAGLQCVALLPATTAPTPSRRTTAV